jgi:hypothetical protein
MRANESQDKKTWEPRSVGQPVDPDPFITSIPALTRPHIRIRLRTLASQSPFTILIKDSCCFLKASELVLSQNLAYEYNIINMHKYISTGRGPAFHIVCGLSKKDEGNNAKWQMNMAAEALATKTIGNSHSEKQTL